MKDSPFSGVGSIKINGRLYTGTLIAPRYVLTAAHVVSHVAPESITFTLSNYGEGRQQIGVAAIYVYPSFKGFAPGKPAEGDLAIIKLEEAATGYPSYRLLRRPLQPGTTLTMASFGASGYGDVGVSAFGDVDIRRLGTNDADIIQPSRDGKLAQSLYYFDFDGPDGTHNLFGGPNLGNDTETSLASGDSGSPAFVRDGQGEWLLAGVNTFRFGTATTFGNGGGGQVVAAYAAWIDSIINPPQSNSLPIRLIISAFGVAKNLGHRLAYFQSEVFNDL